MLLIPPYTGDSDLDTYLYNVYLGINSLQEDTGIKVDEGTGIITDTNNNIMGFLYRYLSIKYADDNTGLNISDLPTYKSYFGIYNSNQAAESTNPTDYTWIPVGNSFSADKYLWVLKQGNRQLTFYVGSLAPDDANWALAPTRSIDLDKLTTEYKRYLSVKYADDLSGTGLSSSPINKTFYGIYTSDTETTSSLSTDYEWSPFSFNTNFELYYRCYGGRSIDIVPYADKPLGLIQYRDNSIINLDVPTFAATTSIGIVSEEPLAIVSPSRYLLVKYADSITGTGITSDATGKLYFGLQASDIVFEDNSPTNYNWFYTKTPLLTSVNLWYRSVGNNIISFSLTNEAPDTTGWFNAANSELVADYIDTYSRSGNVVTQVSSPTDGRIGYTQTSTGTYNINLDPYGQGSDTGGFSFDPASTAEINVDQFGRIIKAGALDQVRYSLGMVNATAGQTVFNFSNEQPNQVLFFKNGILLNNGLDYTTTTTTITLVNPCVVGDSMSAYYIRLIDAVTSTDKVPFTVTGINLVNGQMQVPYSSDDGSELLFINGVLIVDTDYTYLPGGTGFQLNSPISGGQLTVIEFVRNNANTLVFTENYTEKSLGSNLVSYPTPFQRNSSLIWFNGTLLKPTTDYSIGGAADLSYNISLIDSLNISGQPLQFCSFVSGGPASVGSLSSAGVLGYDVPIEFEKKQTIKDMFLELQSQIKTLTNQVNLLKGVI